VDRLPIYLPYLALIVWLWWLAANGGQHAVRQTVARLAGRVHPRLAGLAWLVEPAGVLGLVVVWIWISFNHPIRIDGTVYWEIDLDHLYSGHVNELGAYLYSPAFAQVAAPFTNLSWPVWYSAYAALNLVLLGWLLGPPAALVTLLSPAANHALWQANIHYLTAAAAVLAVRWPAAFGFPLLTKVTPGVAVLWLVGRRNLRGLAVALGTTAAVSAISFVLAPQLWADWIGVLRASNAAPGPITLLPLPLLVRVAAAAAIVLIGGAKGWAWTIPVAMVLAQPVFWGAGLAALVAVVPLTQRSLPWPLARDAIVSAIPGSGGLAAGENAPFDSAPQHLDGGDAQAQLLLHAGGSASSRSGEGEDGVTVEQGVHRRDG
jgi:hypothetical protein